MRHGHFYVSILSLALVGLYGCGDDVTDPDAFLESAEAEAIMQSARELPVLPALVAQADPDRESDRAILLRANELWVSGTMIDPRSEARRRLAVSYALPVLVESLTAEQWAAARADLDAWVVTLEGMVQHLAMPEVRERAAAARRYLERSASAGNERRAAYYLLLSTSELVETTPGFVARRLVDRATTELTSYDATHEGAEADRAMERARRLKDWAEQAVAEGEYLLAIQRAYYAIQLVEGS